MSDSWLVARGEDARWLAEQPPADLLHTGSGWGALEVLHRGGGPLDRAATPFPEASLGSEQAPWLDLVQVGRLPDMDPALAPLSYLVSPGWADRLERTSGDDWHTWLHRGVAHHYAGRVDAAVDAWRRSLAATPNAWALRNLAVVAASRASAVELLRQATALAPEWPALVAELLEALLDEGRSGEVLAALDATLPEVAVDPLVRFLEARAAVASEQVERAEAVFADVTMPWVREGSRSLDDLWFRLETLRIARLREVAVDEDLLAEVRNTAVLPYAYDFRMSPGPPTQTPP